MSERWAKRKETSPKFAVCWHGHVAFMRAVFKRWPDATIKSSIARFRGKDDFDARHRGTANLSKRECYCEDEPDKPVDQPKDSFLRRLIRLK